MGDGTGKVDSDAAGMGASLPENVVENKLQGERFVFKRGTGGGSSADVSAFDFFLAPGGGMPQMHCHLKQSEIFRVQAGTLTVLTPTGERVLRAGDELRLGPGDFHAFVNRGVDEVRCDVEYRPAGKNEHWLKVTSSVVVLEGRAPTMLEIAPFVGDVDMFIAGPPIIVQRVLFAVLASIARVLGHEQRMLACARRVYGPAFVW